MNLKLIIHYLVQYNIELNAIEINDKIEMNDFGLFMLMSP